jgi:DNA-binding NarL/FixJ family response regulator
LREELSVAMRRAIHAELADIILQVPMPGVASLRARGHHLQESGKSEAAVECFLGAADVNELERQFHEALIDLEQALDAEQRPPSRVDLLRRTGYLASQLDSPRAMQIWEELARLASAIGDDETYAYAMFQQYWTCNDGSVQTRLERAAALGSEELGWSARAAATLRRMDGDHEAAMRYDTIALEAARRTGDIVLEALALEKLAVSLADLGRLGEAVAALTDATNFSMKHRLHERAIFAWGALAITLSELLETNRAVEEAEALLTYVTDLGLERFLPLATAWLGGTYRVAGRINDAVATTERAIIVDRIWSNSESRPFYYLMHYEALVDAGTSGLIDDARTQAREATERLGYDSWIFEQKRIEVVVLLRAGNAVAALELARQLSIDEPLAMGELALALTRNAAMSGSQEMLDLGLELARSLEPTAPLSALLRDELDATRSAMSAASGSQLFELVEAWKQGGRLLDALRCEIAGTMIEVNAGRGKEMVDRLKELRSTAANMGASWDADHIASVLRGLGTRSRAKSRTTQVGPLTKRELEIARLVASGLKNSEVAGTLFLAEKTVAAHLSNIYGKVEVKSRVQLTGWIRENDPEFEQTLASA